MHNFLSKCYSFLTSQNLLTQSVQKALVIGYSTLCFPENSQQGENQTINNQLFKLAQLSISSALILSVVKNNIKPLNLDKKTDYADDIYDGMRYIYDEFCNHKTYLCLDILNNIENIILFNFAVNNREFDMDNCPNFKQFLALGIILFEQTLRKTIQAIYEKEDYHTQHLYYFDYDSGNDDDGFHEVSFEEINDILGKIDIHPDVD